MGAGTEQLIIRTLGPHTIHLGERPVDIRSAKATALLVYLAETNHAQSRASLAGMLWPDRTDDASRNNLRQALHALRKAVPDHLEVNGDRVSLGGKFSIDTRPITAAGHHGSFLQQFEIPDSELFEQWVLRTRAAHELVALSVFAGEAEDHLENRRLTDGLVAANRILDLEPWNETAHRLIMRLLAASGRVSEAVEQYDRCIEALWQNIGVRPERATTELLASIEDTTEEAPAPLPTLALVVPSTNLVGRTEEIGRIAGHLNDPSSRLVSLVGPGGVGKTRLAAAVAAEASPRFPTPVASAALDGIDDPGRVAPAIAAACGLNLGAATDPVDELAAALASRHQLLLIDNAEQVVDAVADVCRALLERAPTIWMLVTSRSVLDLSAEHVTWVEGLSTEPAADALSPAVQLFTDRAERVVHGFVADVAVDEICRHLGGLPLAIELAARLVGQVPPPELLERLRAGDHVLTTDVRDVPARHRSMTAVIESAWAGVDPQLSAQLTASSVFRGGFDVAAASAVAGADSRSLHELAGRSLVARRNGRIELHELIRQHGATLLEATPDDLARVRDAHMHHYISVLADSTAPLVGTGAASVIDRLVADFDNIAIAWRRAIDCKQESELVRATLGMRRLIVASGRALEGLDLLAAAADATSSVVAAELIAAQIGLSWGRADLETSRERFEKGAAAIEGDSSAGARRARAMLATEFGQALAEIGGDIDASRRLFEEAEQLTADLDEPDLDAYRRVAWAKTENTVGNFDFVQELLSPALEHYEREGHIAGAAEAHSRLAMNHSEQYRVAPALAADTRALELFTSIGNTTRRADMLLNVAASYVLCGDFAEAERRTREAQTIFTELHDDLIVPYVNCQLAEIRAGLGDREGAERLFVEGITALRENELSLGLRLKLSEWARFLVEDGRFAHALLVLDEAAAIWRDIGGDHFLLAVRAIEARALHGLGRLDEARALALEVWNEIESSGGDGLPFPIESIMDCCRALDDEADLLPDMFDLAEDIARRVLAELPDPRLRASYLEVDDVKAAMTREL